MAVTVPLKRKKNEEIPTLAGLPQGTQVGMASGVSPNTPTISQTPVNVGNKPWTEVPSSKLDIRGSASSKPLTTEEQARFNRPTGDYRKVDRPRLRRAEPVGRYHGDNAGEAKMSAGQQMPDFSRGGSRANQAVQKSMEAKWMLDRGKGADALALAKERGGQQLMATGLTEAGAMNRATMSAQTEAGRQQLQSQMSTASAEESARLAEELEAGRTTRAQEAESGRNVRQQKGLEAGTIAQRKKEYGDYRKSFLSDPLSDSSELLSEEDYFGGGGNQLDSGDQAFLDSFEF